MRISGFFAVLAVAALPACATVIDFEAQAMNTGGNLTGIPNSPLSIDIATFTGGELRQAEVGLTADESGVYASEGSFGSGETNPLLITFASPVKGFSILVINNDAVGNYTVSDDVSDSVTQPLAANGAGSAVFALADSGISTVEITSPNADTWNFAIDNVTFTAATTAPEPAPLTLLALGAIGLFLIRACVTRCCFQAARELYHALPKARSGTGQCRHHGSRRHIHDS